MRERWAFTVGLCVIALVLCFITPVFPVVWMSPQLTGRVVDSAERPIPNATVTASWLLTGLENYPVSYLALAETTTNAQGQFVIPRWGPRFHFGQGRLMATEPQLRILATGYVPRRIYNRRSGESANAYVRFPSDVTVHLRPLISSTEHESGLTELLRDSFADEGSGCAQQIPRTIAAIRSAKDELARDGIP
jgi:hypothetical protein